MKVKLFLLAFAAVITIHGTFSSIRGDAKSATVWDPHSKTIRFTSSLNYATNSSLVDWGLTIPNGTEGVPCSEGDECLDYGVAKVVVTYDGSCQRIDWTTSQLAELKDCLYVTGHWYGGGAQFNEPWPLEKLPRSEVSFVTSDTLQLPESYGGVTESFWVSSQGVAAKVEDSVPLFFSMPDTDSDGTADQMCFSSKYEPPYVARPASSALNLTYHLCFGDDVLQVYNVSYSKFFQTPQGIPDQRMFTSPIWSTWAEYGANINEAKVLSMAQAINDQGFNNSQIEIDDNWESCYGDATFNLGKFPDPPGMVSTLKAMGFRVTVWIHPFINDNCQSFAEADQNGYFIRDSDGKTSLTKWWQGSSAGLVDFTNADAIVWWTQRLDTLQSAVGIDSFKFDAGETSWLPQNYTLNIDESLWPNGFTSAYVHAVANYGPMIETRVGHSAQNEPIFIRMLDKFSDWTYDNGLRTLVPSLLHQGIVGYPFVLPDMVGGNAYSGRPDEELFIRWAQANTFMPTIQFSLFPWNYANETVVEISRSVTSLHYEMAPLIITLAQQSSQGPILRPTWWLCPTNEDCLTADQQFLLGDDILVTPVVDQGVTSLDVVFPPGTWERQDDLALYEGPSKQTISGITITSNVYFVRIN